MMSIKAFTLIELMVVVAVLTILVTISMPRLYQFLARARQAEAKANLGTIHSLQEAYLLEHDTYWNPGQTGATNKPLGWGKKYGYKTAGNWECSDTYHENKLGFVLPNCSETRYGYTMGATAGDFYASAHANSDKENWLYPRCIGSAAAAVTVPCTSASKSAAPVSGLSGGMKAGDQNRGDAWCTDPSRTLQNYVDIIENCAGK